jgi:hypothetical protein
VAEPTNVLARLLTTALDDTVLTPDDGRALTAAHEDDWRAWWLASMALSDSRGDQAEAHAARARACALIAANPALNPPPILCVGVDEAIQPTP